MKALVFNTSGEPGKVLHLQDIPQPQIAPTQVLVAVKTRPVNPITLLSAP